MVVTDHEVDRTADIGFDGLFQRDFLNIIDLITELFHSHTEEFFKMLFQFARFGGLAVELDEGVGRKADDRRDRATVGGGLGIGMPFRVDGACQMDLVGRAADLLRGEGPMYWVLDLGVQRNGDPNADEENQGFHAVNFRLLKMAISLQG